MAERDFFGEAAEQRAKRAVKALELHSSIELVVSVQRCAGDYRAADRLLGLLAAMLVLLALLFLEYPFDIRLFPVDLALTYFGAATLSSRWPALRRCFTGRRDRQHQVDRSAKVAFVERGISNTRERGGMLVFVALFERQAVVIPDIGVDLALLGTDWTALTSALQSAVARLDFEALAAALEASAPAFARAHPRRQDDLNELPDEVVR